MELISIVGNCSGALLLTLPVAAQGVRELFSCRDSRISPRRLGIELGMQAGTYKILEEMNQS